MPLTDSLVDSAQLRKESLNLKIGQQKLPKLKCKETLSHKTKLFHYQLSYTLRNNKGNSSAGET